MKHSNDSDSFDTPPSRRWAAIGVVVAAGCAVLVALAFLQPQPASQDELRGSWLTRTIRVEENVGLVEATFVLSAPASDDVVIELEARGTAVANDDFQLLTPSLNIAQGQDRATAAVLVMDDGPTGERRESVKIGIVHTTNGRVGAQDTFTIVIEESRRQASAPRATLPRSSATTIRIAPPTTTTADQDPALSDFGVEELAIGSMTNAVSASTEEFASSSDSLLLLLVSSSTDKGPAIVPKVHGSLRWELVETSTRNENGPRRVSIFRAMGGADGPLTATIDFDRDQEVINWIILEVIDVPSEQNAAVVQSAIAAAVEFEFRASVALEPLESQRSITVGAFFIGANRAAGTDGFTTVGPVGPAQRLLLGVVGDASGVGTAEWPTRAHWVGVAVEIGRES